MTDPDELDLALVSALQMRPRAPWSLLGKAIGVSSATAARRWQRLSSAGIAWVTAYAGPAVWERQCIAFLELDCAPAHTGRIAHQFAAEPHVLSVEHVADGCDLLLMAAFADVTHLSRYITESIGAVPGVVGVRARLITRVHSEASSWRLGALDAAQRGQLVTASPAPNSAGPGIRPQERELLVALGADGRMDQAALAASTGTSATTVRRRLARLIAGDAVRFRCEVATRYSGRPVSVTYRAAVPAHELDAIGEALAGLPEIRLIAGVTGPRNLWFVVWLRAVTEVLPLEARLTGRFAALAGMERSTTLRFVKRMGRLLDTDGRATGNVPMDFWYTMPVG